MSHGIYFLLLLYFETSILPDIITRNKHSVGALVKLTNIKCNILDKPFAGFRHCHLKVLKRNVIGMNLYVEVYQLPVSNVSVNLSLWKKANGFHPFLYNINVDFCDFMVNRKRTPFFNIFVKFFENDSNINHTCPYNHDIIINDLVLTDDNFRLLPLPNGDYLFKVKLAVSNVWRVVVDTYMHISMDDT